MDWETKCVGIGIFCVDTNVPVPKYDCNPQKGFSLTVKPVSSSSCPKYDSYFDWDAKKCQ